MMKKVNMVLGGLFGAAPAGEKVPEQHKTMAEEMLYMKSKGFNVRRG